MRRTNEVLLVDDDQDILEAARRRLQAAGYRISTAVDGDQALAAAVRLAPDAIVLDVRMPRVDGMTTLARLKHNRRTRDIPIVMLSASLVDQRAALDAGARFFVTKPFSGKNLVAAVASAIEEEPPNESDGNAAVPFPRPTGQA